MISLEFCTFIEHMKVCVVQALKTTWREGGIQIPGEGTWMKKIQNLKDTYRNEENAMKKRRKSHGTT